jgi:hypothetical protein
MDPSHTWSSSAATLRRSHGKQDDALQRFAVQLAATLMTSLSLYMMYMSYSCLEITAVVPVVPAVRWLQVAAPGPLPGGSQVQIYDLAGFKLSMVNSELIMLFKVGPALFGGSLRAA